MAEGLAVRMIGGVTWAGLSTAVNMLLQTGSMVVLARLLSPADFGLVAMCGVSLRFISYFSQLGVGPALVQKKDVDAGDIRAAFTLAMGMGLASCAVAALAAPLAGMYYRSEAVVPLMRVQSLSFVTAAAAGVAMHLLRREMRFKALAAVETASYALGLTLPSIALAWLGFGAWSLILAGLCQSLLTLAGCYALARHPLRPCLDRARLAPFLSFGSRYSFIGFMEFINGNLDSLTIGRILSKESLGLYNRAMSITSLPIQLLVNSISKVLFPLLSSVQHDTAKVGRAHAVITGLVGLAALPTCLGMVASAHDLVVVLLGERWAECAPVVQVLGLYVPVAFLAHIAGVVLDSQGQLAAKLYLQFAVLCVLAALFFLFAGQGLVGLALAVLLTEIFKFAALTMIVHRRLAVPMRLLGGMLAVDMACGAVTAGGIWAVQEALRSLGYAAAPRLAAGILAGAAGLGASCAVFHGCFGRHLPAAVRDRVARLLGRLSAGVGAARFSGRSDA